LFFSIANFLAALSYITLPILPKFFSPSLAVISAISSVVDLIKFLRPPFGEVILLKVIALLAYTSAAFSNKVSYEASLACFSNSASSLSLGT